MQKCPTNLSTVILNPSVTKYLYRTPVGVQQRVCVQAHSYQRVCVQAHSLSHQPNQTIPKMHAEIKTAAQKLLFILVEIKG